MGAVLMSMTSQGAVILPLWPVGGLNYLPGADCRQPASSVFSRGADGLKPSVNALRAGPKPGGKETVEIRGVYIESDKAPVSGYGVYVVVEEGARKVLLLNPWTLKEFEISAIEYTAGAQESYWPVNTSNLKFDVQKLVDRIKLSVQEFALRKRTFPTRTVMRVLSELGSMPMEEVESLIKVCLPEEPAKARSKRNKLGKQYRLAKGANLDEFKGRPRVVLDAIQELGNASVHMIVDKVQGKLKSKLDHERVVTYFVNRFHATGVLELVGEQLRLKK